MTKKRNVYKPKGTGFTSEIVTELYLALWALGDAITDRDFAKASNLHIKLFGLIPDTSGNVGSKTRARNIRRKRNEAAAQPLRRFEDLTDAEQETALAQLESLNRTLLTRAPASVRFDRLSDEEQISELRGLWGEA